MALAVPRDGPAAFLKADNTGFAGFSPPSTWRGPDRQQSTRVLAPALVP
jgi:hypothetical protein